MTMYFDDIYSVNGRECIIFGARKKHPVYDLSGNYLGDRYGEVIVRYLDSGELQYGLVWEYLTWVRPSGDNK